MTWNTKQEWKNALIDDVVPEVRSGRFDTDVVVPSLRDALLTRYEKASEDDPDDYAEEVVLDILYAGCRSWVTGIKSSIQKKKVAFVNPDGTVVRYDNMGVRGIAKPSPDGTIAHQQMLWQEMNEDEFFLMYRGVIMLATTHSMIAAAFRKIADAFAQHPEAKTVKDACRLAHIDPEEIEIKLDDVRRLIG